MTTPIIRPDAKALLEMIAASGRPPLDSLDPVSAREVGKLTRAIIELDAGAIALVCDYSAPGPAGAIGLRRFDAREEREPGPVVVFLHGGGFVIGDLDSHAPLCAEIARRLDLPVVSVDYRLAPEAPFPAAPEDCIAAARAIAAGGTASELILIGDSAGANLAIVTAIALRDEPAAVPIAAQALLYPVTETAGDEGSARTFADGYLLTRALMDWFDDHYAATGDDWRRHPLTVDQAGLPPTLVMTAGLDPLLDQGRAYAAACATAGVETHYLEAVGNLHGFATMRRIVPSSQSDVERFLAQLEQMIGRR